MEIQNIFSLFDTDDTLLSREKFGNGHINYTYLVSGKKNKYIIQKINTTIFDNPVELMKNIRLVTEYVSEAIKKEGSDEKVLKVVKTKEGKDLALVDGGAYRMYYFVDNSVCYEQIERPLDFYNCGYAFGKFATQLDGFDANLLYPVIPNFHNTVSRFEKFEDALAKDVCGRAASVKNEIEFFISRKSICNKITSLLDSGEMPSRVTHNDTKLNNILFSSETGKPFAVIDLDTVMAGSVCYDFGDSIRFGCNTAAEDEPDTSRVGFSVELFKAYVEGYLKGFDKITKIEKDHLLWGAILMTYECGMRFLTDYLSGDTYFHISRENHNLDRARTQMRMVELMEQNFDELQSIIDNA
ncbi:MAG: aminoglycoside phosphotransferase family protein [Clostridiales bacterium]|nr:aminoglycoside phosphotransferase family protein [Clostridiales bacterium]